MSHFECWRASFVVRVSTQSIPRKSSSVVNGLFPPFDAERKVFGKKIGEVITRNCPQTESL